MFVFDAPTPVAWRVNFSTTVSIYCPLENNRCSDNFKEVRSDREPVGRKDAQEAGEGAEEAAGVLGLDSLEVADGLAAGLDGSGVDASHSRLADIVVVVGDGGFIVSLCRTAPTDESRRSILNGAMSDYTRSCLSLVQALLGEVSPERNTATDGESLRFREPGHLSTAIE